MHQFSWLILVLARISVIILRQNNKPTLYHSWSGNIIGCMKNLGIYILSVTENVNQGRCPQNKWMNEFKINVSFSDKLFSTKWETSRKLKLIVTFCFLDLRWCTTRNEDELFRRFFSVTKSQRYSLSKCQSSHLLIELFHLTPWHSEFILILNFLFINEYLQNYKRSLDEK